MAGVGAVATMVAIAVAPLMVRGASREVEEVPEVANTAIADRIRRVSPGFHRIL